MKNLKITLFFLMSIVVLAGFAPTSDAAKFKDLNGPAIIQFGQIYIYSVTVEGRMKGVDWNATGGKVLKKWQEGSQYFCQVQWIKNNPKDPAKVKVWGTGEEGKAWSESLFVSTVSGKRSLIVGGYAKLRNGGGKCLEASPNDWKKNGGAVQIWECLNKPQQRWRFDAQGRLVNEGGKCLSVVPQDVMKDGGSVYIMQCNDSPLQQWQLDDLGRLVNAESKCLEVHAEYLQQNGGRVQILRCLLGVNQRWQLE